jgi:RNA polymerase sigma factor (sigma-70 family)
MKSKAKNFKNDKSVNLYFKHDLLGESEFNKFQDYIQLEITLFEKLLEFDQEFFELMQRALNQLEKPISLPLNKKIDIKLFKEIRMSDDLRKIIDITTAKAIGEKNGQHIKIINAAKLKLRDELIMSNTRLAVIIVRKYVKYSTNLTIDDLIQEGIFGIMKAIDRFDPELEYKFSTYASWWIRHRIQRAISDLDSLIRYPAHVYDTMLSIKKIENNYLTQYGIVDNEKIAEIIKNSTLRQFSVKNAMESKNNRFIHLDAPLRDEDFSPYDVIPNDLPTPFDNYEERKDYEYAHSLLEFVSPMEAAILKFRFGIDNKGDDLTLEEIGVKYHLTRERIRQIEKVALSKLKMKINSFKRKSGSAA